MRMRSGGDSAFELPDRLACISSTAALPLVRCRTRLPAFSNMAIVSLALPGLPGTVVIDTIRLFRPAIPVVCLSDSLDALPASGPCIPKHGALTELRAQLNGVLTNSGPAWSNPAASSAAVEHARAAYELSGDLTAAARELARGMPRDPAAGA